MNRLEPADALQQRTHEDLDAFLARHRRRAIAHAWRALAWQAALLVVIALAVSADLAVDVATGASGVHLTAESILLVVALVGVLGTGLKLRAALQDGAEVLGELEVARLDLAHWRGDAAQRSLGDGVVPR